MASSPVEISVQGADKLHELGTALRKAGSKDLKKELFRAMQRSAKPLKLKAREAALERLPSGGGLNARVAAGRFGSRVSTSRTNAGVRITGTAKTSTGKDMDLRALDRGRLRHPLYGNRKRWYQQNVDAGWFTQALEQAAPSVRVEILAAIDDVARKLEASV